MRRVAAAAVPLVLLVAMAALRINDLQTAREDALVVAERRAANLATITSSYLHDAFGATDAALRQMVLHSQRVGGPTAAASLWMPSLSAAQAGLPITSLSIVDAAGTIRHSTLPAIIGQSRRDEPAFRALITSIDRALVAGAPFPTVDPSPGVPRYIIPLGRTLIDSSGRPEGAVIASFMPAAAQEFLRSVDVGQSGALWVFHPDGVLLYREPSSGDDTGRVAAEHPVFVAAKANGAGVLHDTSSGDAPTLSAYVTGADPPLVVAISLDEREVLASWRREASRSLLLFGIVSGLLLVVLAILFREMGARSVALRREQQARSDAEAANAVKEQFLMTLSHELRTPLTAISGWTRMLELHAVDEAGRARAIAAIGRNVRAQERLIGDLLDVSGIAGGKLALQSQPVDIPQIAELAIESSRPLIEAKGLILTTSIDHRISPVSGDPDRLRQVIGNLLANAVKFTPTAGRISVDVRQTGDAIEVTVSDTGVGIGAEFVPHLFERFRQEDATTTRQHGGLGLGLSIVRSLVELHGGTVTAHSDGHGRGATFCVSLPVAPSSSRVAPALARSTALS